MINPRLQRYVRRLTPEQDYLVREFVEYYADGGLRRRDLLERVLHIAGSTAAVLVVLHELADQVVLLRGEPADVALQPGVDHGSGSSLTAVRPPRAAL